MSVAQAQQNVANLQAQLQQLRQQLAREEATLKSISAGLKAAEGNPAEESRLGSQRQHYTIALNVTRGQIRNLEGQLSSAQTALKQSQKLQAPQEQALPHLPPQEQALTPATTGTGTTTPATTGAGAPTTTTSATTGTGTAGGPTGQVPVIFICKDKLNLLIPGQGLVNVQQQALQQPELLGAGSGQVTDRCPLPQ